jgi:hypothetical protein
MRLPTAAFLGATLLLAPTGCGAAAGTGAALSPKTGPAVDVSAPDRTLLAAGGVVTRPLDFERGDSHYVGGVASGLVAASPERVLAALDDASALEGLLPRTKRASLVDDRGTSRRIELLQGNSLVDATYTVELSPPSATGEVRFHLDPTRRHDIDDLYGYFKVERFDDRRSLVTVAAAVDVGSGLTTLLFGKRVQDVILSTPYVMRDYFARMEPSAHPTLVAQNAR